VLKQKATWSSGERYEILLAAIETRGQDVIDVVDGKVPDLILRRPEQLWLFVCWEASGALKAVREECRR
jgi:hypothetical protein